MGPQQRKVLLFKDLSEEGFSEEHAKPTPKHDGKRGVVKVPSLLFDIELEETASEETKKKADEDIKDVLWQLKSLVQPWNAVEAQLHQQVQRATTEAQDEGAKLDAHQLARKLELPGYTFKVRAALGGGWSGDCLKQLRHFFLTCVAPGSSGDVSYVIDPCFREQFEIANPTTEYASILAQLPQEFIGTEDRIASVVNILSAEIKRSFQATGATLPPWRHPASMLSKWRPRRSEDITVAPSRASTSTRQTHLASPPEAAKDSRKDLPSTVELTVSSSIDDVAATMAENKGYRKLGLGPKLFVCSPQAEGAHSAGKRCRGQASSGATKQCPSLLATKLRGVSQYNRSAIPNWSQQQA